MSKFRDMYKLPGMSENFSGKSPESKPSQARNYLTGLAAGGFAVAAAIEVGEGKILEAIGFGIAAAIAATSALDNNDSHKDKIEL